MHDTITIKSLSYFSPHGYYDSERENGNHFELDIIAEGDFRRSADSQDLGDTFDYEKAEKIAGNIFNGPSIKLIETLCNRIGRDVFKEFPKILNLTVVVRKLNPPLLTKASYAEIKMKWQR